MIVPTPAHPAFGGTFCCIPFVEKVYIVSKHTRLYTNQRGVKKMEVITDYKNKLDLVELDVNGKQKPVFLDVDWSEGTVDVKPIDLTFGRPYAVAAGQTWWIRINGNLDATRIAEWLEKSGILSKLNSIEEYFTETWTGRRWVGDWECNQSVIMGVYEDIEDICEDIMSSEYALEGGGVWDIYEYLHPSEMEITAGTTDEEIVEYAAKLRDEAENDNIVLVGDIEEYLRNIRDEKISE